MKVTLLYLHAFLTSASLVWVGNIESDDPPTNAEIARRVEHALRSARCLEVTTVIRQELTDGATEAVGGTDPVTIESVMAKKALRTLVFDDKHCIIMKFSLEHGRFREYQPDSEKRPLFEYDPPYENGTDDTVSKPEKSCLVGGHIMSWVGVPADNDLPFAADVAQSMRSKIENGTREPDQNVRGHDCYVFKQQIQVAEDNTIEHVVFVDKDTYFVVGWNTSQPGVNRIREQEIRERHTVPMGFKWSISADDKDQTLGLPKIPKE